MPAVAIVGGALGVASGVSAIAAGATGFAALSAGALAVGGAMTVAGAVTGNKTLSKFGSVLGIAGSIGGLATGSLGDPSKVFSGGGTVDTGGAWFGGGSSSGASGAANSTGGLIDTAPKASTSGGGMIGENTVNLGNSTTMTSGAARTRSSVGDALSVNPPSWSTPGINGAPSSSTSIFDKLAKYDKLTNIAGGIADYYGNQKKLAQDQVQFNQALNLKQTQMASGANVNVGITTPATYQPVQPIAPTLTATPYKTTGLIAAGA